MFRLGISYSTKLCDFTRYERSTCT